MTELQLPLKAGESLCKVELLVGREALLDPANRYFFGGKIHKETVEGWGFTRYVVDRLGPMAGTRMAPLPRSPKVKRFVPLGGEPYLIRYNSKVPVVLYTPSDAEARYRIWCTAPETKPLEMR